MDDPNVHEEAAPSTYTIVNYPARQLPDRYLGLILATWTKSLRHSNDWFKLIDPAVYYKMYRLVILNILSKPETMINIAVLTEDRDVAFGYCIYRENVLDYIFVLADYRNQGIGYSLLPYSIDTYTHVTNLGKELVKIKTLPWMFNPFI